MSVIRPPPLYGYHRSAGTGHHRAATFFRLQRQASAFILRMLGSDIALSWGCLDSGGGLGSPCLVRDLEFGDIKFPPFRIARLVRSLNGRVEGGGRAGTTL